MCKSVLAVPLFAFVDVFDDCYELVSTLQNVYERKISLPLNADNLSLYGLCISLCQTTERQLQINLALIREACKRLDIPDVIWIISKDSAAES